LEKARGARSVTMAIILIKRCEHIKHILDGILVKTASLENVRGLKPNREDIKVRILYELGAIRNCFLMNVFS